MGIIDQMRTTGLPSSDDPPTVIPGRMWTLTEFAAEVEAGRPVMLAARDFLDMVGRVAPESIPGVITDRPALIEPLADAMFAALAEDVAIRHGLTPPRWATDPERFLDRFWFVSEIPGFRAQALAQTPIAFKRRGIFWPARSMRRV